MADAGRWHPGRLLVGWALGVLTSIGIVTAADGWYEYRQLSVSPGTGTLARRLGPTDTACQVDREAAINVGSFVTVPGQPDPCYLRRSRIRPWQWADGIAEIVKQSRGVSQAGGTLSA